MRHPSEIDLALYAGAELTGWRQWSVRRHVRRCAVCREQIELFRQDREELVDVKSQLPEFVNWERLAAEMQGNIRVGLAAGECVAVRGFTRQVKWQHAIGATLAAGLLLAGWMLNLPYQGFQPAGRAPVFRAKARPELQVTPGGVQIREQGGALTLLHDGGKDPENPAIYTSEPDSLSVRAFNNKTGQITVHMVSYAQ